MWMLNACNPNTYASKTAAAPVATRPAVIRTKSERRARDIRATVEAAVFGLLISAPAFIAFMLK